MIESLWIAGILIALSAFGIKVGLGIAALCYNRILSLRRKLFFLGGAFLLYLFLFFSIYAVTRHFQLLPYLGRFLKVLRYGMLIHLFIALGLLLWGVKLLLGRAKNLQRGAVLLIFPCPVCATVILLTLSLSHNLFSFSLLFTTGLLFGIFLGICLLTTLVLFPLRRQVGRADSSFLGLVMIMVAAYFLLTVTIAPIYQEAQDVYRLASQTTGNTPLNLKSFLVVLLIVIVLFGVGFLKNCRDRTCPVRYKTKIEE